MVDNKDKRLQELYMQLQVAGQQIQQLNEQATMVETQMNRLQELRASLGDVKTLKGRSAFSSLGAGVFVASKIENASEVLVGVGANVFVAKSVSDAQDTIDKQIKLSANYLAQMGVNLQLLNQQAAALQSEAESLVR